MTFRCQKEHGHEGECVKSAEAFIAGGVIQIRIPVDYLPVIVDGAWAAGGMNTRWLVTDAKTFAQGVCTALNQEDEVGTTAIHRMFDKAFLEAIEQGTEGIEEHPDQKEMMG